MKKILLALVAIDLCLSFHNHLNIKKIMTKQERFEASLGRLDTVTNTIADDLKKLRDEIKNDDDVSDASLDKLDANITKLESLGADPGDPVPDPTDPGTVDPNA